MLTTILSEKVTSSTSKKMSNFSINLTTILKHENINYKVLAQIELSDFSDLLKKFFKTKGTLKAINNILKEVVTNKEKELDVLISSNFDRNFITDFDFDFYFDLKYSNYSNKTILSKLNTKSKELEAEHILLLKELKEKDTGIRIFKANKISLSVFILNEENSITDEFIDVTINLPLNLTLLDDPKIKEKYVKEEMLKVLKQEKLKKLKKHYKMFRKYSF